MKFDIIIQLDLGTKQFHLSRKFLTKIKTAYKPIHKQHEPPTQMPYKPKNIINKKRFYLHWQNASRPVANFQTSAPFELQWTRRAIADGIPKCKQNSSITARMESINTIYICAFWAIYFTYVLLIASIGCCYSFGNNFCYKFLWILIMLAELLEEQKIGDVLER